MWPGIGSKRHKKKVQWDVSGSGKGPVAGNRRSGPIKGWMFWQAERLSVGPWSIFLGAFAKLPKATISFIMFVNASVRMEELSSYWTDFHEIWYLSILRKWFKTDGYVAWRPVYIFIISRLYLLRMRNVWDRSCRENQNTLFILVPPPLETLVLFEVTWKNILESGRPQMTVWHMRIACRIAKATNTHSEHM